MTGVTTIGEIDDLMYGGDDEDEIGFEVDSGGGGSESKSTGGEWHAEAYVPPPDPTYRFPSLNDASPPAPTPGTMTFEPTAFSEGAGSDRQFVERTAYGPALPPSLPSVPIDPVPPVVLSPWRGLAWLAGIVGVGAGAAYLASKAR